eukprot:147212_1
MFKNYNYDGSLKQKGKKATDKAQTKPVTTTKCNNNVSQTNKKILKNNVDIRHSQQMNLGDPKTADIRIVGLGRTNVGNSSLISRLFYNEYSDTVEDHKEWEQHQMNYKYSPSITLRISYFDLKGFDGIISKSEMSQCISSLINHSFKFNVFLLYYSIDNKKTFSDNMSGYSIQNIKHYMQQYLTENKDEYQLTHHTKFATILVGLKSDLKNERQVSIIEGNNLAAQWNNIPFLEVSAKSNQNVKMLLDLICKLYVNGNETCAFIIDNDNNTINTYLETKEEKHNNNNRNNGSNVINKTEQKIDKIDKIDNENNIYLKRKQEKHKRKIHQTDKRLGHKQKTPIKNVYKENIIANPSPIPRHNNSFSVSFETSASSAADNLLVKNKNRKRGICETILCCLCRRINGNDIKAFHQQSISSKIYSGNM